MGKLTKVTGGYGKTPNELLNNKTISLKAKGLYAYIDSKPQDWEFAVERIARSLKEGAESINSGLQELENIGYLERKRYQDGLGHWQVNYILYDSYTMKTPHTENPDKENPGTGKPPKQSNKDITNKDITNKEITVTNVTGNTSELLQNPEAEEFGNNEINSMMNYWVEQTNVPIKFNNKYERRACRTLIQRHGMETLKALVRAVNAAQSDPYAPRIAGYSALRDKSGDLAVWIKQQGGKQRETAVF